MKGNVYRFYLSSTQIFLKKEALECIPHKIDSMFIEFVVPISSKILKDEILEYLNDEIYLYKWLISDWIS